MTDYENNPLPPEYWNPKDYDERLVKSKKLKMKPILEKLKPYLFWVKLSEWSKDLMRKYLK